MYGMTVMRALLLLACVGGGVVSRPPQDQHRAPDLATDPWQPFAAPPPAAATPARHKQLPSPSISVDQHPSRYTHTSHNIQRDEGGDNNRAFDGLLTRYIQSKANNTENARRFRIVDKWRGLSSSRDDLLVKDFVRSNIYDLYAKRLSKPGRGGNETGAGKNTTRLKNWPETNFQSVQEVQDYKNYTSLNIPSGGNIPGGKKPVKPPKWSSQTQRPSTTTKIKPGKWSAARNKTKLTPVTKRPVIHKIYTPWSDHPYKNKVGIKDTLVISTTKPTLVPQGSPTPVYPHPLPIVVSTDSQFPASGEKYNRPGGYSGYQPPATVASQNILTIDTGELYDTPGPGATDTPLKKCPTVYITAQTSLNETNSLFSKEGCSDLNIVINSQIHNHNIISTEEVGGPPGPVEAAVDDTVVTNAVENAPPAPPPPAPSTTGPGLPNFPGIPQIRPPRPSRPQRPGNTAENDEGNESLVTTVVDSFTSSSSWLDVLNPLSYPLLGIILTPLSVIAAGGLGLLVLLFPLSLPGLLLARSARKIPHTHEVHHHQPVHHGWYWHDGYKTWTNAAARDNFDTMDRHRYDRQYHDDGFGKRYYNHYGKKRKKR